MNSIKQLRENLHLTQEKMAERLGITRNYLALIETGRRSVPPRVKEIVESISNNVTEDAEENQLPHDNQTVDKLFQGQAQLLARLESLDARVSSVERLLLRLLAGQGGGGKKES